MSRFYTGASAWEISSSSIGSYGVYLGIDLGGTSTKIGMVSGDGNIMSKVSIPTPRLDTRENCNFFAHEISLFARDSLMEEESNDRSSDVKDIGLAVPGVVENGVPTMLPNVKLDIGFMLESLKANFPQATTEVINDCNAAALGEMWHGSAKSSRNIVLIMLGTGIGSGVVVDGKIVLGASGAAGEIGHMTVDTGENARPCGCGKKGCLERYASATGLVVSYDEYCLANGANRRLSEDAPVDAKSIFGLYKQGDPAAIYAIDVLNDKLGMALADICALFNPELIAIGGGVSKSADVFLPGLRKSFERYCIEPCRNTRIEQMLKGSEAGILGSVCYCILKHTGDTDAAV